MTEDSPVKISVPTRSDAEYYLAEITHRHRHEMNDLAAQAHVEVARHRAAPARWAAVACAASVLFTVAGIVLVCLLPANDEVKIVAALAVAIAGGGTAVLTLRKAIDKLLV